MKKKSINNVNLKTRMLLDQEFAFSYIQENYASMFKKLFDEYGLISHDAGCDEDDGFQDFCINLIGIENGNNKIATYDPTKDFDGWIYTCIKNFLKDKLKTHKDIVVPMRNLGETKEKDIEKITDGNDSYEITGETAKDRKKILNDTIQCLNNETYRIILEELLINYSMKDKKEIRDELGMDSRIFSNYERRAIEKYLDILIKKKMVTEYEADYILAARRSPRQTEPGVMGFMTTMSFTTTLPTTNSPYQWLIDMLRKLASEL